MSEPVSFQVFDISASALAAERTRLAVISQNIANAEVTKAANGQPYRRQRVMFQGVLAQEVARRGKGEGGVPAGGVRAIVGDAPGDFQRIKDPGHKDADKDGWVMKPNVNVIEEMVDMIDSSRTYEANLSALRTWKQMLSRTLEMNR
ncbi:MAG: flagellar basal body rod protein FlgC [Planctomycetes bacterium]|nr:flagellar basal body rod protein FlgC [Planctomycetota bacterium]